MTGGYVRRLLTSVLALLLATAAAWESAAQVTLGRPDSLKFAVVGDAGTGDRPQFEVAQQMVARHAAFPFDLVLLLGDNIYGTHGPQDLIDKFDRPYKPLLNLGVRFFATLGNHDDQNERFFPGFNMGGERYFTYVRRNVRFFVLDTNLLDAKQIAWLERALAESRDDWKIVYQHHGLYSDAGRHGSNVELRVILEPLFVNHGVRVVFSGHDHVYNRIKPQKGITYFVAGSGGQLRRGDVSPTALTAAAFDQDQCFMLVEVAGDELFFQAISRSGAIVDSGVISRRPTT